MGPPRGYLTPILREPQDDMAAAQDDMAGAQDDMAGAQDSGNGYLDAVTAA